VNSQFVRGLATVCSRGCIAPGEVITALNCFAVPKADDIHMVYDVEKFDDD